MQFLHLYYKFHPSIAKGGNLGKNEIIASHLKMVNEVGRKILSPPKLEDLYQEIAKTVQNAFHFHHISIWTYEKYKGEAVLKAKEGLVPYAKEIGDRIPIERGMIGWSMKHGETLISNDVTQEPKYHAFPGLKTKSELCCVIQLQGQVMGCLNVESEKMYAFEDSDVIVIEHIADLCAVAIQSIKNFQEVKEFNRILEKKVEEKTKALSEAQQMLQYENKNLKTFIDQKLPDIKIIGNSLTLKELLNMVDRIAPTDATVVVQGESGTGKELIAKRLHEKSHRANAPYVTINCGALNENLLISELFGHEKGSFTGAHQQKIGLVETAHQGTLFLDEIGEMGKHMQTKLLRFLQEGEFYRVGGKKALKVNVRVISATNKDLEYEVQEGNFREDLFYRLNTITLRVPPLRKRKEDIEHLVHHFLKTSLWGESKTKEITPDALQYLTEYQWPGNIRELQNVVERLKILSDGKQITKEDIGRHIKFPKTSPTQTTTDLGTIIALEDMEKTHILRTLEYFDGNKTKAAMALGITIKTLYNKLNRYIEPQVTH